MADQEDYRLTNRRPTNELETDTTLPESKKVLLYGWDSSTLSKVRLAVDANGYVKIDPTGIDSRYLLLDQTTPQTTIGGIPISTESSAPTSPIDGLMYLNTSDHKLYIYYYGSWQVLHELSAVAPEPTTGNPIGLLLSLTYS